jgi:EpsI family protein
MVWIVCWLRVLTTKEALVASVEIRTAGVMPARQWSWPVIAAAVLMTAAFGLAQWLTPRHMLADQMPALDLESALPASFAGWAIDSSVVPVLPDPTVSAKLQTLYTATLNRTYQNTQGERVMLSIAYGKNQNSESTAAPRPEFCYTAQGFLVNKVGVSDIRVHDHNVKTVQLVATVGMRVEPITYWVTLGKSASIPGLDRKISQIKYGLQGWIVDGMLMRISSLSPSASPLDREAAYALQQRFINDLYQSMAADQRARFFGS